MTTSVPVSGASPVVPSVVAPRRVDGLEVPQVWPGPGAPAGPRRGGVEEGLEVEVAPAAPSLVRPPRREWRRWGWRKPGVAVPEGALSAAKPDVMAGIGAITTIAMAQAGWNLASFMSNTMHLPDLLAWTFPVLAESTAGIFALQDMRDRREGHRSWQMRASTYVMLGISAAVNGAVGVAEYQWPGLLEVAPPIVLGWVIHSHGERATRAYESRERASQAGRGKRLRRAQIDSALEALPLLAGDDADGRATVGLLRRRLEDATLSPAEALIAAGWHDRENRQPSPSRRRRLETIAATVWPDGAPPAPLPVPDLRRGAVAARAASAASVTASVGSVSPASVSASRAASAVVSRSASRPASASSVTSAASSVPASAVSEDDPGTCDGPLPRASDEEIASAVAAVLAVDPGAGERPVGTYIRTQLRRTAAASRVRPVLAAAKAEQGADGASTSRDASRGREALTGCGGGE